MRTAGHMTPVVAVGLADGDGAGLARGGLSGFGVVGGGLPAGGVAGRRAGLEQGG
jgi:hypothetical protein